MPSWPMFCQVYNCQVNGTYILDVEVPGDTGNEGQVGAQIEIMEAIADARATALLEAGGEPTSLQVQARAAFCAMIAAMETEAGS